VNAQPGDVVKRSETLAVLRSLASRELELKIAETELRESRSHAEAEKAVAQAKIDASTSELAKQQLLFRQAQAKLARAEASGGELDLLNQQVKLAENRLQQIRSVRQEQSSVALVSQASVDQQQLAVEQAKSTAETARIEAEESVEQARLSLETARQQLEAARLQILSHETQARFESLQQRIELLRLQLESTLVVSPIDGMVLRVDVSDGQATTGRPLMHVADLSHMVCRAEVDVADVRRVVVGAISRITSPALDRPLKGHVRSVSRLVGSPTLANPNPAAPVDWRSAEVLIDIEQEDMEIAARFVQLQVDLAIEATLPPNMTPIPAEESSKPSVSPAKVPAS
jgi:HlyD family secretion protein